MFAVFSTNSPLVVLYLLHEEGHSKEECSGSGRNKESFRLYSPLCWYVFCLWFLKSFLSDLYTLPLPVLVCL
ncbi:hypothetical protein AQUCO_00900080v1 [Aquilegia coerulea]|uniref:Uncharacterized protein n=1 Tax=Aquilegia coerulea TaxID=218851 RepID=A0A2G5EBW3_AQUCA|nr:hypothetical protein AQUCO_00900080v1 [Aquilegia coerulea]